MKLSLIHSCPPFVKIGVSLPCQVSYNSLINAYAKGSDATKACQKLQAMSRDLRSWTAKKGQLSTGFASLVETSGSCSSKDETCLGSPKG